ncbi:MAG TPA: CDP-alcohol phosphatidyltransferase family protein [Kofleriaceae bacterium]|nr:CDP-alcohol phosphatidyltransferase family protein [Kofleriaceae bacterium]
MDLDAVVLAESPLAAVRIAGLTARDRGVRVARRAGASRVVVVEGDRAVLSELDGDRPLLVIRADQLVHTPLVAPLVASAGEELAIAVGPDGSYAGALLALDGASVLARLRAGESDDQIARDATARVPHGSVARHAIATDADRAGAHRLLFSLLVKPQDNVITRYLFRPLSSRLTRVLVHTPVTATQVSLVVAVMVALGCWMTTFASTAMMIGGALVILAASYLDCCDGEIARVKLQASTFGAWLDTIVDELSSVGYMIALGWHCHLVYGRSYFGDLGFDPWIAAIWLGVVTYGWSLYCIYFNIIVGVGSANSQDYASRFDVVPGASEGSVALVPRAPKPRERPLPPWLDAIARFVPNIVRRDFIVWLAAVYAVLRVPHISFATHILGGVVSSIVVTIDHIHLRQVRRSIARAGQRLVRR